MLRFDDLEPGGYYAPDLMDPSHRAARAIHHPYLDSRVTFNAADAPLKSVLDSLAGQSAVRMVVNWRAMEASGIEQFTRINIVLRDVPLGQALNAVSDTIRPTFSYLATPDTLLISSAEELDDVVVTRAYDIRPMVRRALESGHVVGWPLADDPLAAANSEAEVVNTLWNQMSAAIGPGISLYDSGTSYWAGHLIMTQTPRDHERIFGWLAALHRAETADDKGRQ